MVHPTGPSHVWKELGLPPAMPIRYAQALHTSPWSIVGELCVGAAPAPKPKKYVIVNNMIGMGQKVMILNLAGDKEGRHFIYITRRIVSKIGPKRKGKDNTQQKNPSAKKKIPRTYLEKKLSGIPSRLVSKSRQGIISTI